MEYDSYDDPRYPIKNLHTATKILRKSGQHEFYSFCQRTGMPSQDIERVQNKVNRIIENDKTDKVFDKQTIPVNSSK